MDFNVLQILLGTLGISVAVVVFATLYSVFSSARREGRDAQRLAAAKESGANLPASIRPVIDYDLCSGCQACLNVCPEGDLFGIQQGKAVLIEASRCIGHGVCQDACPTNAISLVYGSKERSVEIPETDQFFETNRPGVFIVGELGGMGLIKNALKQGSDVAGILADRMEAKHHADKDVAIVGAGPAGIAAAAGCRSVGLSFRIFDQESVGGTVAAYPRQKLILSEPVRLPLYGRFGDKVTSKEQLMSAFREVLAQGEIEVHEGVKALDLRGRDGAFEVVTSSGTFSASKVVLALGRRGSPRKLGVPGEDLENVTYLLIDPEQYRQKRVLVVGGGDSAAEAAIMLAEEGVDVTLSYRKPELTRCKSRNRERVEQLVASGQIVALMSTTVTSIEATAVSLRTSSGSRRIDNDFVIVCAGGELPSAFLAQLGIEVKSHRGDVAASALPGTQTESKLKPVVAALYVLGAIVGLGFLVFGWDYYVLDRSGRIGADFHEALKPSGPWGHGIGIAAALMMATNFLYSARKRRGWFSFMSLQSWMALHTCFGIIAPIFVAFHSAFQSNNLVATATTISTIIVVVTGLVGRYFFALLPVHDGKLAALKGLKERQRQLDAEMRRLTSVAVDPRKTKSFADHATAFIPAKGGLIPLLANAPQNFIKRRQAASAIGRLFSDLHDRKAFSEAYFAQLRLRMQIVSYTSVRRFISVWRILHISLAGILAALVLVHIAISLYLGFGWILF